MEKRIEAEMRGRAANEVMCLNLDACKATTISGLTEEFTALNTLSIINVGLTTLKDLPALRNLKRLELAENRLTGGLEALKICPELTHVNLSGNKIADMETLVPLTELQHLISLDLYNCDVSKMEDYRAEVFKALPGLKFLDGFDVNDEEAEWDELEDDISEEESDDYQGDEETSEVGLEYLESSNIVEDEDETEDFAPGEGEEDVASNSDSSDNDDEAKTEEGSRGTKRKHEDD